MRFDDPHLLATLENASASELDAADFGVIRMARDGSVLGYNAYESRLSGLSPESVLGRNFFTQVAPCTNNFMVAERYVEDRALDAVIDYVFTYKMKPTKIRLRLLKRDGGDSQFLLVLKA